VAGKFQRWRYIMKNIIKNFSFLIVSQGIYKILSFITFILLARCLGVSQFGVLSYAISFVYLFDFLTDFGISVIMVRDISGEIDNKLKKYFNNVISLKIILSLAVYCFIILVSFVLRENAQTMKIILLLSAALLFDSYSNTFRYVFNIFERMFITALSTILEGFVKCCFIIVFINYFSHDLITVAQLYLSTSLLIFFFNFALLRKKFIKFNLVFDLELWATLLKTSVPIAFLALFQTINFRINVVMLSKMTDSVTTGIFAAGVRIIEPILVIPFTFTTAMLPTISRFVKTSSNDFFKSFNYSLIFMFFVSLPFVILLFLTSKSLIVFLLGKEFIQSGNVVKAFAILLIPFFIRPALEYFAFTLKKYRIIYFAGIAGTSLNIVLNIIFLPRLSYNGACLSMLIAEFFIAVTLLIGVKKLVRKSVINC
jgi:O-antigen/teichoic acid export membrane protein